MADVGERLADIEARLVAELPGAVKRGAKRWRSPPWCCALVFDGSQPPHLPPELALSTVAERDAWLATCKKTARAHVWNCVAFDGVGAGWFTDKKLLAACDAAEPTARQVSQLLARVAKHVNGLPVASFGAVPDEFVVYAFDRNAPATKLLAPSLTAKKRATLARLGLV